MRLIIFIILITSLLFGYIYVYILPWLKGTMVTDDDPNCQGSGKKCHPNSWCCRDPREGGAYCVTKECSDIRLEIPLENNVKIFNIYIICVIIIFTIMLIVKKYV
jgi:hypothetical protein